MDEKELIKRTKNSMKAKKSHAEILSGFQKKGYKLEYAEKLISKANRKKKILTIFLFSLIIISSVSLAGYSFLFNNKKLNLTNPMDKFTITGSAIAQNEIPAEQIEITPEFISYLLNEFGAWELHANPLTFEKPLINFKIGEDAFNSEVGKEIKTERGLKEGADLQFNSEKENFIEIISSENPAEVLRNSISQGEITIDIKAGEVELLAKGYLKIYNSIK
jgi:flagellar basal body-associated protein FliL